MLGHRRVVLNGRQGFSQGEEEEGEDGDEECDEAEAEEAEEEGGDEECEEAKEAEEGGDVAAARPSQSAPAAKANIAKDVGHRADRAAKWTLWGWNNEMGTIGMAWRATGPKPKDARQFTTNLKEPAGGAAEACMIAVFEDGSEYELTDLLVADYWASKEAQRLAPAAGSGELWSMHHDASGLKMSIRPRKSRGDQFSLYLGPNDQICQVLADCCSQDDAVKILSARSSESGAHLGTRSSPLGLSVGLRADFRAPWCAGASPSDLGGSRGSASAGNPWKIGPNIFGKPGRKPRARLPEYSG